MAKKTTAVKSDNLNGDIEMGQQKEDTAEQKLALSNKALRDMQTDLDNANQINADLQNHVEELELKLAKRGDVAPKDAVADVPTIPTKSFKHEGEEYVFTAPKFTNPLNGHQHITAEEALHDKDLLAHLVTEKTGVIMRKADVKK